MSGAIIGNLLSNLLPVAIAMKGLENVSPKMKSFLASAGAAGYTADQTLDFLRSQFLSSKMTPTTETSRPDELSAEKRKAREDLPLKVAQGAGTLAVGLGAGALASKMTPAVAQVAKQVGQAQQAAPAQAAIPAVAQAAQAVAPKTSADSFIAKHPELGAYLDTLMSKHGMTPRAAAMKAKGEKRFQSAVMDIEQNTGEALPDLIARFFQDKPGVTKGVAGSSDEDVVGALNMLNNMTKTLKM